MIAYSQLIDDARTLYGACAVFGREPRVYPEAKGVWVKCTARGSNVSVLVFVPYDRADHSLAFRGLR